MFTNRDEVLEKALRIFAKMNYEKASQMEIAKTCGLSKAGLVYYFPFKLDLFKAVVDKYVFDTQHSKNKFNFTANSLSEFIDQYVAGVENMMQRLVHLLDDGNNPSGCSFNFYYYHLLMQVRLYYPNVEKKLAVIFEQNYQLWKSAIQKAKENGEIRQDLECHVLECTGRAMPQFQHISSLEQVCDLCNVLGVKCLCCVCALCAVAQLSISIISQILGEYERSTLCIVHTCQRFQFVHGDRRNGLRHKQAAFFRNSLCNCRSAFYTNAAVSGAFVKHCYHPFPGRYSA